MTEAHIKENRVVRLDTLVPHPENFKLHPEEELTDLIASLKRFGQGRSIVVQDGPEALLIVAGHGTVEAARTVGWSEIRADVLPAHWTPEQIEGYMVADNRIGEKAVDNTAQLTKLLQRQMKANPSNLASVGSSQVELTELLAAQKRTHATDFLTPFLKPPTPADAAAEAENAGEFEDAEPEEPEQITIVGQSGAQYYQLFYAVTAEQRNVVNNAIRTAQERWLLNTSQEALVQICEKFLAEVNALV